MVILDMEQCTLAVDGQAIELQRRVALLLQLLIQRRGRCVSCSAICSAVIKSGRESENCAAYAWQLAQQTRRAISSLGITIKNRYHVGYILVMPEGMAFPVVVETGDET